MNTDICDICKQPIAGKKSLTGGYREQYIVKIKHIVEGETMAGYFKRKQTLDVCTSCMKKFVEFANSEVAE